MNHNVKDKKPYLIGITGSFGAGKSAIGEVLRQKGVCVFDTDELVRDILNAKSDTTKKIVHVFGKNIVSNKTGEYIDRNVLGEIVFDDKNKRKELESIVHPVVIKTLLEMISAAKEKKIIAVLVPLLFETGFESLFNETWCIVCNNEVRVKRLVDKGYTQEDIQKRSDSQFNQNKKAKLSNYVIDNSGDISDTRQLVIELLERLGPMS